MKLSALAAYNTPLRMVTATALAAGVLLVPAAAAHADTQPSHFVWTATSASMSGSATEINNLATNNEPGALLYVTPNYDAGGVNGVLDNAPIGVYYDDSTNRWTIFTENATFIPVGAQFNVLVEPAATADAFTVTANAGNISGDTVWINSSATNNAPKAVIQATQVWSGSFNNNVAGVWYSSSTNQAGVFNEGGATMVAGTTYNVLVGTAGAGGKTSLLRAIKSNIAAAGGDAVSLGTNKVTAGDSNAFVFDTPNWDPNGSCASACVYDTSQTGMSYFPSQWNVFNESQAAMHTKTDFNLMLWNS